jgi:hypothetical protein
VTGKPINAAELKEIDRAAELKEIDRLLRELLTGRSLSVSDIERAIINSVAERLKAKGVRAYRGKALEIYAEVVEGITVKGLKQRRRRERRRRERRE